jgi:RNA polymerase sigma factor (sigma-70 family)
MPSSDRNPVLRYIRKTAATTALLEQSDPELLGTFIEQQDQTAFEMLVRRHGPMVLGLCLRVLRDEQDAEDAFQATFLVFTSKAASLRPQKSLAGWLYRVAYRTAQKARIDAALRRKHEGRTTLAPIADPLAELTFQEAQAMLDRELNRLPDRLRVPLVLCYLEGLTRDEAAGRLGWSVSLLKSRLEQARDRLRVRLTSRGLTLAGVLVAPLLHEGSTSASVPPVLVVSTVKAATALATGSMAGAVAGSRVAALTEGVMRAMFVTRLKSAVLGLVLLGALSLGMGVYAQRVPAEKPLPESTATLEPGRHDAIHLSQLMNTKLGIEVVEVKPRGNSRPQLLRLIGYVALDPRQTWSIKARLAPFEVLEIGQREVQAGLLRMGDKVRKGEPLRTTTFSASDSKSLRVGDTVPKRQVLAVLSSAEVSQKKHDLFSALVQLRLDEKILKRAEESADAVPEAVLLNARRNVEADHISIARALNTLKTWGIPDDDISAVRKEAREAADKPRPDTEEMRKARLDRWRKVTLRSPADGTILERNVSLHETVTDSTVSLFRIANTEQLLVIAEAPEEDLSSLQSLTPGQRRWTIEAAQFDPDKLRRYGVTLSQLQSLSRLQSPLNDGERTVASVDRKYVRLGDLIEADSNPPIEGTIDEVSYVIDPKERTAIVKGHVDNRKHQFRAGQRITATIVLPTRPADLVVPSSAVVEESGRTFVFVQPDSKRSVYEQRRVLVVRRGKDAIHVPSQLTPEQLKEGYQSVRAGERVVTAGALEVKAMLDDLKTSRRR